MCNYTSRNVIIPNPEAYDNEIYLSYHTFLDLYKFKIIYYLMKMEECTLAKAHYEWQRASVIFNETFKSLTHAKLLFNVINEDSCCEEGLYRLHHVRTRTHTSWS